MNASERDPAVDLAKCLAVLLIVNSHLDACYPPGLSALATGGAVGNALFFFCSGYTLARGRLGPFASWYKRRLARILPSFLVCSVVCSYLLAAPWWPVAASYWFVRCILAHYVVLYVVRARLMDRQKAVWLAAAAAIVGWWVLVERPQDDIYKGAYFLWLHYLPCTLLGLFAASFRRRPSPPAAAAAALGLVALYYGVRAAVVGRADFGWVQLALVPAVALAAHFLLCAARARPLARLMASCGGRAVRFVGGLSLEIYMIHFLVARLPLRAPFPLNLALVLTLTLLAAYLLRVLARFTAQTFGGGAAYDVKALFEADAPVRKGVC